MCCFVLSALTINDLPGMVGTIDQTCNILNVAEDAYDAASSLCDGEWESKNLSILKGHIDMNWMIYLNI